MENLKKCPTHKFGADYIKVSNGIYQCKKCGAFIEIDKKIGDGESVIIKRGKNLIYEFKDYFATII